MPWPAVFICVLLLAIVSAPITLRLGETLRNWNLRRTIPEVTLLVYGHAVPVTIDGSKARVTHYIEVSVKRSEVYLSGYDCYLYFTDGLWFATGRGSTPQRAVNAAMRRSRQLARYYARAMRDLGADPGAA